MKITIIHPSRSRPDQAFNTMNNWLSRADNPDNIEYMLSIDSDEANKYYGKFYSMEVVLNKDKEHYHEFTDGSKVCIRPNKTAIEAINHAVKYTTGDLFIVVSDDMDCPQHWDTQLLTALQGKSDYCVKVSDGKQPFIMTLPIMDRKYYERFGYIYYPGYQHMFCDTEMSCVAWMLDRYTPVDVQFTHRHYSYGLSVKDRVNAKNDATWGQGEALFKKRRRMNFELPLADIVNKELPENSGLNVPRYM